MGLNARRQGWDGRRLGIETLEERRVLAVDFDLLKDINGAPGSMVWQESISLGAIVRETLYTLLPSEGVGAGIWRLDETINDFVLVTDIDPGHEGHYLSNLINVNGTLFFDVEKSDLSNELWKSDGTAAGTVLVKEIGSGTESKKHTNVGGVLYFVANDGAFGETLWKSDGTAYGTDIVLDTSSGPDGYYIEELAAINDLLYFTTNYGVNGSELWRSDGTPAGTFMIKDLLPGGVSSYPGDFTVVGDKVFFVARSGNDYDTQLWVTDGTVVGTVPVGPEFDRHFSIENVNGIAYFVVDTGLHEQLWRSDGTDLGTTMVIEGWIVDIKAVGESLFLYASFSGINSDVDLWKSDGTFAGTVPIKTISPGQDNANIESMTELDGILYFWAVNEFDERHFWRSNGTSAGTFPVSNVESGGYLGVLTSGLYVYFIGLDDEDSPHLYRTNPQDDSAVRLDPPTTNDSFPNGFSRSPSININGTLFFVGDDGVHGLELWKSDGTTAGTVLVKDVNSGALSSMLTSSTPLMANINGILYFPANDGINGEELWRSDGTSEGTFMVKDLRPGASFGRPSSLTNVNGTLYFVADASATGHELFKSDGTAAGTVLVKDIRLGSIGSGSSSLANIDGKLFFTANDGLTGPQLWKSDGTPAGTVRIEDGAGTGIPRLSTNLNGIAIFLAHSGTELWRSDGTAAGTYQIKDLVPGTIDFVQTRGFIEHDGALYFRANDGTSGVELWRTDGTAVGTYLVRDVAPGSASSFPSAIAKLSQGLLFKSLVQGEWQWWTSDGTSGGTSLAIDSEAAGVLNDSVDPPVILNGRAYYVPNSTTALAELWSTDGTLAGTSKVFDFRQIDSDALIHSVSELNGRLLVTLTTRLYGKEYWIEQIPQDGDYDANGEVDGADFLSWQRSYGSAANPAGSGADGDGNGSVGAGDLVVWQANFGAESSAVSTATAASVGSEFAAAALIADEEPAEFVVDDGEEFGSAGVGSAADEAFAWLAAERADTDRGGWQRSAREAELLARDWAARSVRLAVTAGSELRNDGGIGIRARKLLGSEFAFDECNTSGDGEELPATLFDRRGERLAAFFALERP